MVAVTIELAVRRSGGGRPVLLLHGLGASSRSWDEVVAAGSDAGFAFVAPDLAGFGRSPKPADAPYDIPFHLAALAPLLQPAMLVLAHSAGTALAAALVAAGSVDGGLLVGAPAFPDEATARREVGRLGLLARLTVERRPSAKWICTVMCRLRPLAVAVGPHLVRDLPPAVVADGMRHTWPSYSRTLDHLVVRHRLGEVLADAARPLALLHGAQDEVAPVDHVSALAAAGHELEVVPGDHHLPIHQPEVVLAALRRLADRS